MTARHAFLAALMLAPIAAPATAQLRADKPADLTQPVTLQPGQGAIVVGFRRPDKPSAGKSAKVDFRRYDSAAQDIVLPPENAKDTGDTTTYHVRVKSAQKQLPLEHVVTVVSEGEYVLFGASSGPAEIANTFCFGAPVFRVKAGEVVYFGDMTPYVFVKLKDGSRAMMAVAYSSFPEDARKALEGRPELAQAFRPAENRNGATYRCAGTQMLAYQIPAEYMPPPPAPPAPEPVPEDAAAEPAAVTESE